MAEAPIVAVSDKAALQVVCKIEVPALHDTAGRQVAKGERKLVAQFVRGGAPDWVIEEAQKRFDFKGRGDGEPVSMLIGVFDSALAKAQQRWTDDEHDAVVRHLRGTQNPYWFIAEEPRVGAPWPTYDKLTVQGRRTSEQVAEKNVETATEIGVPLESLVAYERQNRNDAKVVAAYEAAIAAALAAVPEDELVEA